MSRNWIARLALGLVTLSALAGCGKAAPTLQPMVIDSSASDLTAGNAQQVVVKQQKQQQDQNSDQSDSHDVGGPGDDTHGG